MLTFAPKLSCSQTNVVKAFVVAFNLFFCAQIWAQPETVFASAGGVDLISIGQPSPGAGFLATLVRARTQDPARRLVTFENMNFIGNLHHVWDARFGQTVEVTQAEETLPEAWIAYDSHQLIRWSWLGGQAGCGLFCAAESNDGMTTELLKQRFSMSDDLVAGFGDILMNSPTDASFLGAEHQSNVVDLAYLVTTVDDSQVFMNVGILGDGIVNSGEPDGARFGFEAYSDTPNLAVPFPVPEPAVSWAGLLSAAAVFLVRRRCCLIRVAWWSEIRDGEESITAS